VNKKISDRNNHAGFTLVEMLVVVLIIVILAGLISAAAIRGLHRAKVARISMEINQISGALDKYKTDLGGEYPPDFSDLSASGQQLILRHIARAFPRYTAAWISGVSYPLTWANLQQEIWTNSNKQIDLNKMTPSTALAFWLGGMPNDQGRPSGFSKNPADPFESPSTTPSRIGAFFEFDPGRLTMNPGTVSNNGKYYAPGIIPGSGQSYVYLRAELGQPEPKREYFNYNGTAYSIKQGPASGAKPYWDQRNMGWVNPTSFQILCCGLDGKFGKENVYPSGNISRPITDSTLPADVLADLNNTNIITIISDNPSNFDHIDDQTNFTKGTIGDDLP
jgi:prepilin-type N-terminal cleavage/methylation domain-containing protein